MADETQKLMASAIVEVATAINNLANSNAAGSGKAGSGRLNRLADEVDMKVLARRGRHATAEEKLRAMRYNSNGSVEDRAAIAKQRIKVKEEADKKNLARLRKLGKVLGSLTAAVTTAVAAFRRIYKASEEYASNNIAQAKANALIGKNTDTELGRNTAIGKEGSKQWSSLIANSWLGRTVVSGISALKAIPLVLDKSVDVQAKALGIAQQTFDLLRGSVVTNAINAGMSSDSGEALFNGIAASAERLASMFNSDKQSVLESIINGDASEYGFGTVGGTQHAGYVMQNYGTFLEYMSDAEKIYTYYEMIQNASLKGNTEELKMYANQVHRTGREAEAASKGLLSFDEVIALQAKNLEVPDLEYDKSLGTVSKATDEHKESVEDATEALTFFNDALKIDPDDIEGLARLVLKYGYFEGTLEQCVDWLGEISKESNGDWANTLTAILGETGVNNTLNNAFGITESMMKAIADEAVRLGEENSALAKSIEDLTDWYNTLSETEKEYYTNHYKYMNGTIPGEEGSLSAALNRYDRDSYYRNGDPIAEIDKLIENGELSKDEIDAVNFVKGLKDKIMDAGHSAGGADEIIGNTLVSILVDGITEELRTSMRDYGLGKTGQIPRYLVTKLFGDNIANNASGGVITSQELSWLAEGNKKEAVVPLETAEGIKYMADALQQAGLSSTNVYVTLNGKILEMNGYNARRLGNELSDIINSNINRQGGNQ